LFCRPAKRTARRAPQPAQTPREFVIWNATSEQVAGIERARFRILARSTMTNGRMIVRLRAISGTSRQTAMRRMAELAPGATIGENIRYRSILRTTSRGSGAPGMGRSLGEAVACSADVEVAMIDTGVDPQHPALIGARLTRLDMRGSGREPSGTRHGTAVASLIVGVPGGPTPGIAPQVRLLAIDAFHRDSSGADATDVYDLARALDLVASREARVVNLSLTGPDNPVVFAAISALLERGKLIVAAAGNEGPRARPVYPAAYPGVIAVAALDRDGKPWRHSARGKHIAFAAEGVGLSLAGRNGEAEAFNGTSFSAPIVAAMLAAKIKIEPGAGPERFRDRLISLAADRGEPGRDPVYGHGALDPHDACKKASNAERR
jgi:subtilisin family serine protease